MFELEVKGGKILVPETEILKRSSDEITIKTFEIYRLYLSKVLVKEGEIINVDWETMKTVIEIADYRAREAIRQYIYAVLLSLKILTENPRGAYSFSDESMNPVYGIPGADFSTWRIRMLYFSQKQTAINYGRAKIVETLDNWFIFRAGEVITKQEVCR